MDQEIDHVKRIATLEELLCDLANAVSMGCDAEAAVVARTAQDFLHTGEPIGVCSRIAELEAALKVQEAVTATAIRITKQMAFGEVAQMLLKMAHGREQMTLPEAAKAINDFARAARENDPLPFSADETQEGGR